MYDVNDRMNEILTRAQHSVGKRIPVASSTKMLDRSLRQRRKNLLGSHITLWSLLEKENAISDEDIDIFASYLARQTLQFWRPRGKDAETFCYRFYRLSLFALLSGSVQESIDDLIQLSGALVRSKQVFQIAMEDMLPPRLFSELLHFLEDAEEEFFVPFLEPHFEDAVLYTVASFLGTLAVPGEKHNTRESEGQNSV